MKNTNFKDIIKKIYIKIAGFFKTIFRWVKRLFYGGSTALYNEEGELVEKIESPSKLAVKDFFRRKLQVSALIIIILMFLFVFIGPSFVPMYTSADATQKNMEPNLTLRSVPKELKNNIKSISSTSTFSVGLSNDGKVYVWGATKNSITNINYKNIPNEVSNSKVAFAKAGLDHCIAITENGNIIGWGNNNLGQFGECENIDLSDQSKILEPSEYINGTIDVSTIKDLYVGNQATIILFNDGTFSAWGNANSTINLLEIIKWQEKIIENGEDPDIIKVAMSNNYVVLLRSNGEVVISNNKNARYLSINTVKSYKFTDIACDGYSFAGITTSGTIVHSGAYEYGQNNVPVSTEKFVSIFAGTRHYVALTENGTVYSWGDNSYNQADISGTTTNKVFVGSYQTYAVNENNELTSSYGLKGFIMGTDSLGRDLFARIVHGGKMTMTIGGVAVIISTIVGVIIGCLSGYFGGWVDMLLMRITEIFSALPFLPFAMMLSVVISNLNIDENTRILIIMVILGLLSWTGLARMVRGQILAEREKDFVLSAKAMGVKEYRIAFKHILPNVISIILVSVTLDFAGCMLTESSLSYLGFGVQQPQPTWGNLLNGCNNSLVIKNYWWQWLFPSLFLGIATICINIIGDGLRDVLDPKSSSER